MLLEKYAILGNPLYFPIFNIASKKFEMEFKSTSGGLWIASNTEWINRITSEENKKRLYGQVSKGYILNYVEGSLYKSSGISFNIPFTRGNIGIFFSTPDSLDNLLKENLLRETTYPDFFKMIGFQGLEQDISMIPEDKMNIYYVTEDYKVLLHKKIGKPKEKRQERYALEDFLPGLPAKA